MYIACHVDAVIDFPRLVTLDSELISAATFQFLAPLSQPWAKSRRARRALISGPMILDAKRGTGPGTF